MTDPDLTRQLKAEATRLGFDAVGIAPAVTAPGYGRFLEWLDAGCAAGMDYLARHAGPRAHPDSVLEGVRSVVMVSMVYGESAPGPEAPTKGKVARYARGADYHRVLWDRLGTLLAWLETRVPGVRGRAVVDTAPLLERDFARLAGLGWIGKNTMLINRHLGSFTFLGALLVDCELEADQPHHADHCGTCTRCLEACPTDAFAEPYRLDAGRCISYWTIEHRGPIPEERAGSLDGWVFGCDICQDVCPWNRKAAPGTAPEFTGRMEWTEPDLIEWLDRDPEAWRGALKGSALARAKRAGLVRNAALVLGARRVAAAVPALTRRLVDEGEAPAVRQAAAWALRQIDDTAARGLLAEGSRPPEIGVVNAPRAEEAGPPG